VIICSSVGVASKRRAALSPLLPPKVAKVTLAPHDVWFDYACRKGSILSLEGIMRVSVGPAGHCHRLLQTLAFVTNRSEQGLFGIHNGDLTTDQPVETG
jgi:hypothetical protein